MQPGIDVGLVLVLWMIAMCIFAAGLTDMRYWHMWRILEIDAKYEASMREVERVRAEIAAESFERLPTVGDREPGADA